MQARETYDCGVFFWLSLPNCSEFGKAGPRLDTDKVEKNIAQINWVLEETLFSPQKSSAYVMGLKNQNTLKKGARVI